MNLQLWTWQPFRHGRRTLIVACSECGDREVNESNLLRRLRWTETVKTPRRYRYGYCSEVAS